MIKQKSEGGLAAAFSFLLYTCGKLRRRMLYMGSAFTAPSTTHVEGLSTR
jgi:hypothetical protein